MIDHVSIGVRDLGQAQNFYDALFAPLHFALLSVKDTELGYGPPGDGCYFFLYPAQGPQIAGQGAHIAFAASSAQAVDAAHKAGASRGAVTVRAPGPRPDISTHYYGTIILDPDDNKIEIVHAQPSD